MVPQSLKPLTPLPHLRPLRPVLPGGALPAGAAGLEIPRNYSSAGPAGPVIEPWMNPPDRGYSYAVVLTPSGMTYHWIWWLSQKEYYYLFDPAGARYLGAYDRATRIYRPFDAVAQRWGTATPPPVPVPSEAPVAYGPRGARTPVQQPGNPAASQEPPVKTESRAPK